MDPAHFQGILGDLDPFRQGNDLETIAFACRDLCSEEGINTRSASCQSNIAILHFQQSRSNPIPWDDGPNRATSLCSLQINKPLPKQPSSNYRNSPNIFSNYVDDFESADPALSSAYREHQYIANDQNVNQILFRTPQPPLNTEIPLLQPLSGEYQYSANNQNLTEIPLLQPLSGEYQYSANGQNLTEIPLLQPLSGENQYSADDQNLTEIPLLQPLSGEYQYPANDQNLTEIPLLQPLSGEYQYSANNQNLTEIPLLQPLSREYQYSADDQNLTEIPLLQPLSGEYQYPANDQNLGQTLPPQPLSYSSNDLGVEGSNSSILLLDSVHGGHQNPSIWSQHPTEITLPQPLSNYSNTYKAFQSHVKDSQLAGLFLNSAQRDHYHAILGSEQVPSSSLTPAIQNPRGVPNPRPWHHLCMLCRLLKKKCENNSASTTGSRCLRCVKQKIPASICNQDRIAKYNPFGELAKKTYKDPSMVEIISALPKTACLGHYPNGPTRSVDCYEFQESDIIRTSVLRKNRSGWYWMPTTAYCLANTKIDLSSYIQDCVKFAIDEACRRPHPLSFFFKLAYHHSNIPLIQQCLEMFTGLRLLRIAWQFFGNENLGMAVVREKGSAFYGFKHVPRMVRDQLNHLLDLRIAELDREILRSTEEIMEKRDSQMWLVGCLASFFLLHTRELNAGRLFYWSYSYPDLAGFWDHPSHPTVLIDEIVASCNSILSHFHFLLSLKPLCLSWDKQDNTDNNPEFVHSVKSLRTHVFKLRENGLIGRKACELYVAGNPNSVEFTISSLLFQNMEKGCELEKKKQADLREGRPKL